MEYLGPCQRLHTLNGHSYLMGVFFNLQNVKLNYTELQLYQWITMITIGVPGTDRMDRAKWLFFKQRTSPVLKVQSVPSRGNVVWSLHDHKSDRYMQQSIAVPSTWPLGACRSRHPIFGQRQMGLTCAQVPFVTQFYFGIFWLDIH